jgi:molybdopterin biosynthesis enzyme
MVHHREMIQTQRLPASLTPLDAALEALLHRLEPVAPIELPLAEALGCVAADMPPLKPHPPRDTAANDGWALRASDLVGASSYSPLPLPISPVWVEAGDPLPQGCDCVLDADLLDQTGLIIQALGEAAPGQGVRRAGSDIAGASVVIVAGRRVRPLDLLMARAAGLQKLNVRRPRLSLVNILPVSGEPITGRLIADTARAAGVDVAYIEAAGRDAASIEAAADAGACDLLMTIGGSGVGRSDAAVAALAARGAVIVHGMALQPGRTAAAGRIGKVPVTALPGAPDQALSVWWTLALPTLDVLSGLLPREQQTLPLARKIASSVGITEVALLEKAGQGWMPIAVGAMSLEAIARADAWLAIPAASEGFAAGTAVGAYMLREWGFRHDEHAFV